MIRALRHRFIMGAMAAFGILIVLLMCGVIITTYRQGERTTDAFLEFVLNGDAIQPPGEHTMRDFNRGMAQRNGHMGHYLITANAEGENLTIEERGIWNADLTAAEEYARQMIARGKESGKLSGYKYRLKYLADGEIRLAFTDNSMQTRMMRDLLRNAGLIGLGCMTALFLILIPTSDRVMRSYRTNIEKQKQFITNAGHEIKTPVAIIMSNVDAMELILGENKWSRNIRGQTERMNVLLQKMLFMARIDERSVELPRESVEFNALLGAELETYGELIQEKGLRLNCDLSQSVQIQGSRDYLQQLAHMLLDNAVQYANEGGRIDLCIEKKRRWMKLKLSNTTDALPDCPPEALFDRFYRGDSARTQSGGGYGIGLSAARAICEMHRGRISAEYTKETEITFTVELPLRP